jgi:hypothetical protein
VEKVPEKRHGAAQSSGANLFIQPIGSLVPQKSGVPQKNVPQKMWK